MVTAYEVASKLTYLEKNIFIIAKSERFVKVCGRPIQVIDALKYPLTSISTGIFWQYDLEEY